MPLVAQDSPIFSQTDIDERQAAQFTSIGFSANALVAIYERLVVMLIDIGSVDPVLAIADGLAMVDWTHRLDGLVSNCRGFAKDWPARVDYMNSSSLVETQRHLFQHLEGTIPSLDGTGRSPWGHLAWQMQGSTPNEIHSGILVAGVRGVGNEQGFRIPEVRPQRSLIDHVALFTPDGEGELGLTGQVEALARFIRALEDAIRTARRTDRGILKIG